MLFRPEFHVAFGGLIAWLGPNARGWWWTVLGGHVVGSGTGNEGPTTHHSVNLLAGRVAAVAGRVPVWPVGSGPRYQILSHQKTHGHARIARESRAILA